MKPLAWALPARRTHQRQPEVAIGYRPDAATRCGAGRGTEISDGQSIAAPPRSSKTATVTAPTGRRRRHHTEHENENHSGASLNPDSASSSPATRWGNGSTRSTEKTAAASVEDTIARATTRAPVDAEQQVRPNGSNRRADDHADVANAAAGASTYGYRRTAWSATFDKDHAAPRTDVSGQSTSSNCRPTRRRRPRHRSAGRAACWETPPRLPPSTTMLASSTRPPTKNADTAAPNSFRSRSDIITTRRRFGVLSVISTAARSARHRAG